MNRSTARTLEISVFYDDDWGIEIASGVVANFAIISAGLDDGGRVIFYSF